MDGDKSTGSSRKFLSKVVRFVTNPTTQWSQLDRPADLKGLIERKKRDDLVRGRELGSLRKMLDRGEAAQSVAAPAAAPPASDTSSGQAVAADTNEVRARTLRQIEALDAQMTGGGPVAQGRKPPAAPTALADVAVAPERPQPVRRGSPAMEMGPEIEEVAIHFANGNFGDAESGLLRLVDSPGTRRDDEQIWLMLFDLYRATGQANKFSDLGAEFASHFERSAPQWLRKLDSDPGSSAAVAGARDAQSTTEQVDWRAPPWLDEPALAYLQASLTPDATQWRVDWRGLQSIDPAALPALIDVLRNWSAKTMMLSCLGASTLLDLLAEKAQTHERDVDPNWWLARLALLHLLGQAENFDQAALAYCVTYEVSPPAWTDPLARVLLLDAEGTSAATARGQQEPTAFAPTELIPENQGQVDADGVFRLRLEGELLGDINGLVSALALTPDAHTIECDCHNLRRVDFGAAGALFNWVMDQQGRGRHVVFLDVHRLVAAFFGVIGIADVTAVIRAED